MKDPLEGHKIFIAATGKISGRLFSIQTECKIGENKTEFMEAAMNTIMEIANDKRQKKGFLTLLSEQYDEAMKQVDKMRVNAIIGGTGGKEP